MLMGKKTMNGEARGRDIHDGKERTLGGVPNELIYDSDGSPICIAIDEEANHKIMHLDGFRKTDGLPY